MLDEAPAMPARDDAARCAAECLTFMPRSRKYFSPSPMPAAQRAGRGLEKQRYLNLLRRRASGDVAGPVLRLVGS